MDLIVVGQIRSRIRHYVDVDKYSRLSKAKALCGKLGSGLIHYDAMFFNYALIYPKMCAECKKISHKHFS